MEKFRRLCEMIVEKKGNPSCKDIVECGYTIEHFIRLAQTRISTEKLLQEAKQRLKNMED